MSEKRQIILITDGDKVAQKAVEVAVRNIGGRCISKSAGNPTPLTGIEILKLIEVAKYDPVIIMVDDVGDPGFGKGEEALREILSDKDTEILGVVAVASNTSDVSGIKVDYSVNLNGKLTPHAVDKNGIETNGKILYGDTVDIINDYEIPIIIGIGDIGKMKGRDNPLKGAPIITRALEEILDRSR